MNLKSSAIPPVRPAQLVEHRVITGILDGTFPPGKPMPIIAELAADRAPEDMLVFFEGAAALDDNDAAFVDYDWQLQLFMAAHSGNLIYRLILNDFSSIFGTMAASYFSHNEARAASSSYYLDLAAAIHAGGHGKNGCDCCHGSEHRGVGTIFSELRL